jgi:DNA-binding beta-propeller fold protein YncE
MRRMTDAPRLIVLVVSTALAVGWSGPLHADPPAVRVIAGAGAAGFADGTGAEARFNKPIRLAPLGADTVLVADIFNHALRVVSLDGRVRTLAGAPGRQGHHDGDAATAQFSSPHGVGVAKDGRIAVAEAGGHTLRLLTLDGTAAGGYRVSTLAGVPGEKGKRDGPAAQALFNSPHAAVWDSEGRVYAPDIGNASIRRVADGVVTTVAGAEAGTFVYPMDLALMNDGRLIVADAGANLLRVVDRTGQVTTLSVQGALATPHGVAVGPDGTVYVADMKSHRVLAIDGAGRITTVAGTEGVAGSDAAHLNRPAAVLVHDGWLWIADLDNHRICAVPITAK